MSKTNLKEIPEEIYRTALSNSWDVTLAVENAFPEEITTWIKKKSTELGVPFSYLAYPLLTAAAYCLGESKVEVTESYSEPVILYTLVSGRSGTNKTGCLTMIRKLIESLDRPENGIKQQHVFDSGTMEGLLSTLKKNNGSVLCAVDEFSTFLDAMDKNSNGSAEKSRYLSLWSGCNWSKKTKHAGLEEIENPRFQFVGFNQNYYLINMIMNTNHFDGFLPRFLVATPKERYTTPSEKITASKEQDNLNMQTIFNKIFNTFFKQGFTFKLDQDALKVFESYHDNDVLEFRKNDVFEDTKSMIKSKSIGNVLRIAGIQSAVRSAIQSNEDGLIDLSCVEVTTIDIERALNLVNYSVECLFSLIDATNSSKSKGVKRMREMPEPEAMDEEFLMLHKSKIQKLYKYDSHEVPMSTITRNHLYPQIGGKSNVDEAKKFLKGLEKNGLGSIREESSNKKWIFILKDKENIPSDNNIFKRLGIFHS